MADVLSNPDGDFAFTAQHSALAEHGRLNAYGVDASQDTLDSLAFDDRHGHAIHLAGIADRNLK